jgi:hypothetical protein
MHEVTARVMGKQLVAVDARVRQILAPTERVEVRSPESAGLGWLPLVGIVSAGGLLLIAVADLMSRRSITGAPILFWVGLVLLLAPATLRLLGVGATRGERFGLVLIVALGLQLLKLAWSPYAFNLPDELTHQANVNAILRTGQLFSPNTIIPVTPLYPGLPALTAALCSLSGLNVFQAGLAVSFLARLVLMLALFLSVERLTRSSRAAGLAALLYTAHPNFLFYGAEFGYETLALALAAMVLFMMLARPDAQGKAEWFGFTLAAGLSIVAVVATHHVTSYALVVALFGAAVLSLFMRQPLARGPLDLAVLALVTCTAWVVLVAGPTLGYLSFVLGGAGLDAVRLFGAGAAGRQLFQSTSGSVAAPLWERIVGLGSQVLIAFGLLFGVKGIWRRRNNPYLLLLAIAGLLYLPVQALRLTAAGWETANRSSEFLFFGVAFIIALWLAELRLPPSSRQASRALQGVYCILILCGGVIVGWPSDLRLPPPWLLASADGREIEPQGVALGRWAEQVLGPDRAIAADRSNALVLLAYGNERPITGEAGGVHSMLATQYFDQSVVESLTTVGAQYAVVDRRPVSWDHLVGQFPPGGLDRASQPELADPAEYQKFDDQPNISRIFDSGSILVYDTRRVNDSH